MLKHLRWWEEGRLGMFIHWGIYAIPARGEWVRMGEGIPDEAYRKFAERFRPTRYDAKAWAKLAKRVGMRYAVMTAKHHDGFCLFDSQLTEFKVTRSPAGRDLFREYVEAFRAEGIRVGLYYSLLDWNHADYPVDELHPLRKDATRKAEKRDFRKYLEYMHGQVRELMTGYGKIDLLWLDFSYGEMQGERWKAEELLKMVRGLQPGIVVNNRLYERFRSIKKSLEFGDYDTVEQVMLEDRFTDEEGKPVPAELCMTVNNNWGYNREDRNHKTAARLVQALVECVSKGGNLLLNVGPTAEGEIDEAHTERLETLGRWMRVNGESIYGAGACELAKPEWGCFTQKGKTIYAHFFLEPVGPTVIKALGGKMKNARTVKDGVDVSIATQWQVKNRPEYGCLNFQNVVLEEGMPEVVAIELK